MIFLGWNRASCFPPVLGWELFSWGLKPFITLRGSMCRWVLFPGHSGNGNGASAPSAPHSSPHTAAQEEAGAGSRGWLGNALCPKGILLFMLPCRELSRRSRWWHRAAERRLVQNLPAEQTSSIHCAAQSWPSTQITATIRDPEQNYPFNFWFFLPSGVSLSEGPHGASATALRERQAGAWVTDQQRSMEAWEFVLHCSNVQLGSHFFSFLSLLPAQSSPQQRRMTMDVLGERGGSSSGCSG